MTLSEDFKFSELVKAKRPIDRDRDGKVYDGTKRERPALPSEMMPDVRARLKGRSLPKPGKGDKRYGAPRPGAKNKGPKPLKDQKAPTPFIVQWEDQGVKRTKMFPDKEDALDFARARNAGGAKNVGAFPKGHPKYKGGEKGADLSRMSTDYRRAHQADGNIEDIKGMPKPDELPDGGRKKKQADKKKAVVEPIGFKDDQGDLPDPNRSRKERDIEAQEAKNRARAEDKPRGAGQTAIEQQLGEKEGGGPLTDRDKPRQAALRDKQLADEGDKEALRRHRLREMGRRDAKGERVHAGVARDDDGNVLPKEDGKYWREGFDAAQADIKQRERLKERRGRRAKEMAEEEARLNGPDNKPHFVVHGRNDLKRYPNKAAAEKGAKGGLIIGPDHENYDRFMGAKQRNQLQMEGINRRRAEKKKADRAKDRKAADDEAFEAGQKAYRDKAGPNPPKEVYDAGNGVRWREGWRHAGLRQIEEDKKRRALEPGKLAEINDEVRANGPEYRRRKKHNADVAREAGRRAHEKGDAKKVPGVFERANAGLDWKIGYDDYDSNEPSPRKGLPGPKADKFDRERSADVDNLGRGPETRERMNRKWLVHESNGEMDYDKVKAFDNEDDAKKYMEREQVRNVARETAAVDLDLVQPDDPDYKDFEGRAVPNNTDDRKTAGLGERQYARRAGMDTAERKRDIDRRQKADRMAHYVEHNGEFQRFDNKRAANKYRNDNWGKDPKNRPKVIGPNDQRYANLKYVGEDKGVAGIPGKPDDIRQREWKDIPAGRKHINADGERMVMLPENGGLAPWRGGGEEGKKQRLADRKKQARLDIEQEKNDKGVHYIVYDDGDVGRYGNRAEAERAAKRDKVQPAQIIGPGNKAAHDKAFREWNEQDAAQQRERKRDNLLQRGVDESGRRLDGTGLDAALSEQQRSDVKRAGRGQAEVRPAQNRGDKGWNVVGIDANGKRQMKFFTNKKLAEAYQAEIIGTNPKPFKAKLQVRRQKGNGGLGRYEVMGVDGRGRRVRIKGIGEKAIADNVRAKLNNGRDIEPEDLMNEWDQAAQARLLQGYQGKVHMVRVKNNPLGIDKVKVFADKGERDQWIKRKNMLNDQQNVPIGNRDLLYAIDPSDANYGENLPKGMLGGRERTPQMPEGFVPFDVGGNKRGPNNPKNDKGAPHIAMYFDDKGKHVKAFDNQNDALKFMFGRNAKGKGHADDRILGPEDDHYTLNMAMDRGPHGERAMDKIVAERKAAEASAAKKLKDKQANNKLAEAKALADLVGAGEDKPALTPQVRAARKEAYDDIRNVIGDGDGKINFGNTKKNALAARWADAMYHAADGDQLGFEQFAKDFFKAENDPEIGGTPERNNIMDGVDDLFDAAAGNQLLRDAMENIHVWNGGSRADLTGVDEYPPILQPARERLMGQGGAPRLPTKNPAPVVPKMPPGPANPGDNHELIKAHFDSGGSIADAPNGDVVSMVMNMPERFEVHQNGKAGVSPNWWVIDKSKPADRVKIPVGERGEAITWVESEGETWVFKASVGAEDLQEDVRADWRGRNIDTDILAEVVANDLQNQLGIFNAPARFGSPAGSKNPYVLQKHLSHVGSADADDRAVAFMHPDDFMFRKGRGDKAGDTPDGWKPGSGWLDNLEDPGQPLEMAFFDYLIENGDRHPGNWSGLVMKDGKIRIGVYDNGLGFRRGGEGYPEGDLRYDSNALYGAEALGSSEAIRKYVENFIDVRMAGFDRKKAIDRLREGGASEEYIRQADVWLGQVEKRMANLKLSKEEVIKMLSRGGRR